MDGFYKYAIVGYKFWFYKVLINFLGRFCYVMSGRPA